MYVDKKSPIPVYYQLKNIILKKIQSGEFPDGSIIPSERDLGESLDISRMTVRQALNQLVSEGVLYREKGRGTFVSRSKIEQRNIMSFSETVRLKGMVPTTRVLFFKKEEPEEGIRSVLELKEGQPVYTLKRLRLADNTPVAIEENFIPEKYCPGLERFDLASSLYNLIKMEYSFAVYNIDNVIEASKPSKEEKELLNISSGIPVLKTTGINYTESGLKLFYEKSVYRSDEYKYSIRINVNKNME